MPHFIFIFPPSKLLVGEQMRGVSSHLGFSFSCLKQPVIYLCLNLVKAKKYIFFSFFLFRQNVYKERKNKAWEYLTQYEMNEVLSPRIWLKYRSGRETWICEKREDLIKLCREIRAQNNVPKGSTKTALHACLLLKWKRKTERRNKIWSGFYSQ